MKVISIIFVGGLLYPAIFHNIYMYGFKEFAINKNRDFFYERLAERSNSSSDFSNRMH